MDSLVSFLQGFLPLSQKDVKTCLVSSLTVFPELSILSRCYVALLEYTFMQKFALGEATTTTGICFQQTALLSWANS